MEASLLSGEAGRGSTIDLISAEEFERVFEKHYETSRRVTFDTKSTEAQHYRRFLLQRRTEEKRKGNGHSLPLSIEMGTADGIGRAPHGINDGKGFVFISHLGEVFPSGFLALSADNVRKQSLTELYRHSPLFTSLRDSSNLKGKCGICEFREVCGADHARGPTRLEGTRLRKNLVASGNQGLAQPPKITVQLSVCTLRISRTVPMPLEQV